MRRAIVLQLAVKGIGTCINIKTFMAHDAGVTERLPFLNRNNLSFCMQRTMFLERLVNDLSTLFVWRYH